MRGLTRLGGLGTGLADIKGVRFDVVRLFLGYLHSINFCDFLFVFLGVALVENTTESHWLGNRRVRLPAHSDSLCPCPGSVSSSSHPHIRSERLISPLRCPRRPCRCQTARHPAPIRRVVTRPSSPTMSGLKNSPFGKRLRAANQDTDDDTPRRNRQRVNPAFALTSPAVAPISIPSLNYSQLTASDTPVPESPEHPARAHREYGDRFVPSRDTGDMRTSYHLMDDSGPSTPSKHRTIPTESDAIKGTFVLPCLIVCLTWHSQ